MAGHSEVCSSILSGNESQHGGALRTALTNKNVPPTPPPTFNYYFFTSTVPSLHFLFVFSRDVKSCVLRSKLMRFREAKILQCNRMSYRTELNALVWWLLKTHWVIFKNFLGDNFFKKVTQIFANFLTNIWRHHI